MPGRAIFMRQRRRCRPKPQDVVVRSRLLVYAALGRAKSGTISADDICGSGRIRPQPYIMCIIRGRISLWKICIRREKDMEMGNRA